MNTNSPVYAQLNKAWKATCRILFGEEIGELKEYEEWLKEYLPVLGKRKSHISGKDVTVAFDEYCKDARFVSLDEVKEKSIEPLTINEIKDIDSIIEAISERWEYTGSRILGRSTSVENSDVIIDSHYIYNAVNVVKSQYVISSAAVRDNSRYIFGSIGISDSEFLVRIYGADHAKRCFESQSPSYSSDLKFCYNCIECSDMLFSFNLRNKHFVIGNLQLPKDKYMIVKEKLIQEMVEELKKNKTLPSLFKFIPNKKTKSDSNFDFSSKCETTDMEKIRGAFSSTFKVLFKKEPDKIEKYELWLSRYSGIPKEVASAISGRKIYLHQIPEFKRVYNVTYESRIVEHSEALDLSKQYVNENKLSSLNEIKDAMEEIAFFSPAYTTGVVNNLIKTSIGIDAINIYATSVAIKAENSAVNGTIGPHAKYIFGNHRTTDSQFCIHTYYSSNLTRCFEMDSSSNCSDTYFAHNCEGLSEAMFCWNVKGKRYAIGNAQLPPDQYRKIKNMLIEQMANEILKKKELRYDIFNIGCGKR